MEDIEDIERKKEETKNIHFIIYNFVIEKRWGGSRKAKMEKLKILKERRN